MHPNDFAFDSPDAIQTDHPEELARECSVRELAGQSKRTKRAASPETARDLTLRMNRALLPKGLMPQDVRSAR